MTDNSKVDTGAMTQIGIIVRDVVRTAKAYADFFNMDVPSIQWTGEYSEAKQHYKGNPVDSRAKLVFFNLSNIQIELIEPDEGPSTWRKFLDDHGEGVHHIAFEVNGMRQVLSNFENQSMHLEQKGEYEGGRYAYVDTFDQLKVIVELLEND